MLSTRLIQLIEIHAESLTQEVMNDILTNERTGSSARLPKAQLYPRIFSFFRNLGSWIGNPEEGSVQQEYQEFGKICRHQEIPLSEIVYTLIIIKKHLRRYIRENGLVAFSGDRVVPGELIPLELHGIQELNYIVGDFFDRALYYLARGYEGHTTAKHVAV